MRFSSVRLSPGANSVLIAATILAGTAITSAQTTPVKPLPVKPKPVFIAPRPAVVAPKPVAVVAPKPAAVAANPAAVKPAVINAKPTTLATSTANPTAVPAVATRTAVQPAVRPTSYTTAATPTSYNTTATPATSSGAASYFQPATNSVPAAQAIPTSAYNPQSAAVASSNYANSTGDRSANFAAGLGTFQWADITLTAYGCFRSNTRVFCDFDVSKQNASQIATNLWGDLGLVTDGGRIVARHNAFFLGQDGSQFTSGYASPGNAVRYIMEFDDVGTQFTTVTLVWQRSTIPNVVISVMDPNQAPGTVPSRQAAAATTTTATNAAPAGTATNPVDGANNAVTNTVNNVNTTKQKGISMWQQLKSMTQK